MMLYRRTEAQMPAYPHEIAAAKAEGVEIIALVAPLEFVGTDRVRGVRCMRMKLGAADASGRPKPEPIPGSEFTIEVDTVIKAIGQRMRTELLGLFGIKPESGVVEVSDEFQTGAPDCFAGGDAINGGATVVEAVRDGKLAARAIDRYLTDQPRPAAQSIPQARVEQDNGTTRHLQGDYRLNTVPVLCKGCNVCITSCPTQTLFLNGSNRIAVDNANTCVFCGLCEARCPDFAIWVVKGSSKTAAAMAAESEPAL
jgi:ferredoxin